MLPNERKYCYGPTSSDYSGSADLRICHECGHECGMYTPARWNRQGHLCTWCQDRHDAAVDRHDAAVDEK